MIKNILKGSLFSIGLFMSASAMADPWPVALIDKHEMSANSDAYIDVLSNDNGTGLKVLEVNAWSQKGGRITKQANQSLKYIPRDSFTGEDIFWYVIQDYKGLGLTHCRAMYNLLTP